MCVDAGLDHIFVCSQNLKYCPGSVKAKNFRLHSGGDETAMSATAILNENWAMYLRVSANITFNLVLDVFMHELWDNVFLHA